MVWCGMVVAFQVAVVARCRVDPHQDFDIFTKEIFHEAKMGGSTGRFDAHCWELAECVLCTTVVDRRRLAKRKKCHFQTHINIYMYF